MQRGRGGRRNLQTSVGRLGGNGVPRDLTELAVQSRLDTDSVEGVAAADEHEILLTRLDDGGPNVEQLGVDLVDHDLAAVDATSRVAPLGECVSNVEELLAKTWRDGRTGI